MLIKALFNFSFIYPILMSFVWMVGGLYYYLRRERKSPEWNHPPRLESAPFASILIPCFNEVDCAEETIHAALAQHYPDFEVIAINDGSSDGTADVLNALAGRHPRLRVIHLDTNLGKANALRMGTLAARSEYLVCIDGDALLDEYATHWLVSHLASGSRVGAVTGNPRIRNRSTLLGRLQVGEFSSIIGMIKRAQRVYGRIFTVSGAISAFRRTALHRVGYWSEDMVTEDIDISWRLQLDHWDIRYEPNALCYILMPESLRGLWRQRLRWARGGMEVILRHGRRMSTWRHRRMWGVIGEYFLSVLWACTMIFIIALWALGQLVELPDALRVRTILPAWHGVILALVCLLQFAISLLVDRRYEAKVGRNYYWMIWYPMAYWILNMLTTVVAVPMTLLKHRNLRATWVSPDRGIR
ncbi:poly-beta-1,6 N-acetyl-D-glucosamine synthase [Lysobacter pythonis]|uniref:Poly-beta-1,6-N-acetyl-D-glucosamine synthase n=1 Tax=Solilutibacter pythonis TaxID=2483112 RepID=A0A3M2HYB5_9GAMM|nr:poly-beta-1,6-N-acetyl-D-glucosamine synthase [Lysobacter pythonis]RMH90824.1 poly-beta-1,6 N-acetyl-D-glucosamine synthase [Lysobacter pythonis]